MTLMTSAAQIKAIVPGTPATDDTLLDTLASAAHAFVVSTLGYDPIATDYVTTFDGSNTRQIALPYGEVNSIASVIINDNAIPASVGMLGSGYRFNRVGIVTLNGYCFDRGFDNVKVSYNAGFATYPADLMGAATEIAVLRYKTRSQIGILSKTLAQETITFSDKDMTKAAQTIIHQYVRLYIAT